MTVKKLGSTEKSLKEPVDRYNRRGPSTSTHEDKERMWIEVAQNDNQR